jgi:AAA15 family ATPase/GTPase
MIIMDICLDHFYAFKNFHMNLSYPKKIVNSFIEGEYLEERPNFRYKKAVILMGANATGKTTLGRMLGYIFNLIEWQDPSKLYELAAENNQDASFSIDFLIDEPVLYRISGKLLSESPKTRPKLFLQIKETEIRKNDSYEISKSRLDAQPDHFTDNFSTELDKLPEFGWAFRSSDYAFTSRKSLQILETVLKVLDPAISSVEPLDMVQNSFVIQLNGQKVIVQDGKAADPNLLSAGTFSGIAVADMLSRIIDGKNGFYYCDEKFSCIQSDVEKAILSVMVSRLSDYNQLIFTTHNADVLDMPYPKHTFMFLKKGSQVQKIPIQIISASDYLKRNTDSLRSAFENDLFGVTPNVDTIFELEEI